MRDSSAAMPSRSPPFIVAAIGWVPPNTTGGRTRRRRPSDVCFPSSDSDLLDACHVRILPGGASGACASTQPGLFINFRYAARCGQQKIEREVVRQEQVSLDAVMLG